MQLFRKARCSNFYDQNITENIYNKILVYHTRQVKTARFAAATGYSQASCIHLGRGADPEIIAILLTQRQGEEQHHVRRVTNFRQKFLFLRLFFKFQNVLPILKRVAIAWFQLRVTEHRPRSVRHRKLNVRHLQLFIGDFIAKPASLRAAHAAVLCSGAGGMHTSYTQMSDHARINKTTQNFKSHAIHR